MSTDDLERRSTQTGSLRRLSKPEGTQPKPATQGLVEQVPPWLKRRLTKYGEREGPLVDLGEAGFEAEESLPPTPRGGYTGALSNLLEQMAEEGAPEYPRDQLATSVEWGSPDEPEAPSFDDFLANLGSEQSDYQDASPAVDAPDWITGIVPPASQPEPGYDRYALPPQPSIEDEAPDWLTEMIGSSGSAPPPPPASPQVNNAPDWLTEALETPSSVAQTPPQAAPPPSPPAGSADLDVPDWLTAALETPAAPQEPPAQTPSAAPAPADFDGSGWLAETPVEPALPETFAPPTSVSSAADEASYAVEVPDWLADIAPPMADEVSPPPPAVSTPESPAWDTPDWMTTDMAGQPEEATSKPATPAPESSSWFAQEEGLPSLDWLFEAQPTPPAEAETEAPAQEYPDWLFDSAATTSTPLFEEPAAPETVSPQTGEAVLSWLQDMQASTPVPESESAAITDWLENIQEATEAPEVSFDQPPTWLENLQVDSTDVPETELSAGQTSVDWPAETEEETPSWLAEADAALPVAATPTSPPTSETVSQPVSTLKSLKLLKRLAPQPAAPAERETSPPLPDWAASLAPAEAETGRMSPALPDWAADLIPPGATAAGATTLALPDWAKALLPPGVETKPAPAAGEPPGKPAPTPLQRLSRPSQPAPETPPPAAETPSWLAAPATPMAEEDQTADEAPDWLSDLPSADAGEVPDWMAESSQAAAASSDWLSDLLSAKVDEAPDWMAETDQTAPESPDWMSDLSTKVGEVPDWMAELTGPTQEVAEAAVTGEEWLPEESTAEEENRLAERLDWFTQGHAEEDAAPALFQAETPQPGQRYLTG
ncbi:MAG: hypothetical protein HYR94_06515 [Chloroflexi bacterium]|nr:hypothetical protein [Chloroflexota bacterium]